MRSCGIFPTTASGAPLEPVIEDGGRSLIENEGLCCRQPKSRRFWQSFRFVGSIRGVAAGGGQFRGVAAGGGQFRGVAAGQGQFRRGRGSTGKAVREHAGYRNAHVEQAAGERLFG